ncbi:MAG: nitrogenase-stabilizing/protective protein NifW [Coleofasciculaceae cyanobacterium SM2_1_6]|nr:nitrogenase-stabilizing/protective protein NifW [Coleofasciculaceae cyanobacterium SM2_1_6]
MSKTLAQFQQLVNAEDYLEFFELPYDPQFVNVNRLHILQKFSTLIRAIETNEPDLTETVKLERYQEALVEAYDTFTSSSPLTEKLFKVFKDRPKNVVLLSEIGSE